MDTLDFTIYQAPDRMVPGDQVVVTLHLDRQRLNVGGTVSSIALDRFAISIPLAMIEVR